MGKTYHKNSKRFDDELGGRSGKHAKHANNKKTGGMRTLNSYVEEDIDFDDEDIFDDDFEVSDEITIQHIQNDKT
jgi:hypothetical protein